jgi:hypothetical protein
MARTPTGIKVTKPSNTTGSGVKVQRSQADIRSRDTGSILSGRDPLADPMSVKSPGGDWSSVTTDGDSRGADHQSIKPGINPQSPTRKSEFDYDAGYGER